ncbi:general secretion pathway protein GspL [Sphingomonas gilva]|uniref:General secretion pathway protein GspL n=1 Tax=Sphingomonas gilva TaxID=2305907 RepID=A0A396RKY0_9SPHN|nr:type II secretion system protein GspL [Sphingomonas gilva]RHW16964.1 general secretion pathway protein GspL [Sphingomonas gilva]
MSATTLILHLPEDDAAPVAWSLWRDGAQLEAGEDAVSAPAPGEDMRVAAIAPAESVALHWIVLPDLAPAQARAAATLLAAETSAAPAASLHVALGPADSEGRRLMAMIDPARMAGWLARLATVGHDPHVVHPAPLLLPAPVAGFVRGAIGGMRVVRGFDSAFAEDDVVAPMILAGAEIADAPEEPLDRALDHAGFDLRQGAFARARRLGVDWKLVRRLAMLAGVAALLVLATSIVRIAHYSLAADAAGRRAEALARQALPPGAQSGDPATSMAARLAGLQGAGGGFSALAGGVLGALEDTPDVDLTQIHYGEDGSLRIILAGPNAPALSTAANAIQNNGFDVDLGPTSEADGRQRVELTVRAR